MSARTIWTAVLTFSFCLLGSAFLGFLAYGELIFDSKLVFFQCIGSGALCASLLVSADSFGRKSIFLAGFVAYPIQLAIASSNTGMLFIRDAVYVFGLAVSVLIGLRVNRMFPNLRIGKFVLWGASFGAVHLGMFVLLCLTNGHPVNQEIAVVQTGLGILVGSGVGLGYVLASVVKQRA